MVKPPTMRAVRVDTLGGSVVVDTVRRPRPAAGQVLIRVMAVAVGRPDAELAAGGPALRPDAAGRRTLGREVAGVMAAPGAGVDGWPPGRRVVLRSTVRLPRGQFSLGVDQDGGLADYVVVPVGALVQIPDQLPLEQAAVLDAAATAWSALTHTGAVRPGEAVGIWGVGGLGTHAVQLARLVGAAPVIAVDPHPAARARALAVGADAALDPDATSFPADLRAANGGQLLDLALHLADSRTAAAQLAAALAPEGRAVLVGPGGGPVDDDFWRGGRALLGHGGPRPEDVPLLVRLIVQGRLDLAASVTEVLPLDEAPAALRRVAGGGGTVVRLVLRPGVPGEPAPVA
jgi:threonine dehydrogenase-like Zn-dependent dehydrogenase